MRPVSGRPRQAKAAEAAAAAAVATYEKNEEAAKCGANPIAKIFGSQKRKLHDLKRERVTKQRFKILKEELLML